MIAIWFVSSDIIFNEALDMLSSESSFKNNLDLPVGSYDRVEVNGIFSGADLPMYN